MNTTMSHKLSLLFLVSILIATSFTVVSALFADEDDILIRQVVGEDHDDHHFSMFKKKFGKSYESKEEHDYRFSVFKGNLRLAERNQKEDVNAVHGVTKFSDMTEEEFREKHLGLKPLRFPKDATKAPILPTKDLPADFDWRDHGAVTPVKNQVCIY